MVHLKGYMYKWVMEDLGKNTWLKSLMYQVYHTSLINDYREIYSQGTGRLHVKSQIAKKEQQAEAVSICRKYASEMKLIL